MQRLLHPAPVAYGAVATVVMAVSVLLTGLVVMAQTRALRQTASVAVAGDRAHYFADLGGNLVGLIGVGAAAFLHVLWVDAAAALLIVAVLVWGAIGVFREASDQLMDKGLDPEAVERIRALVAEDPRIFAVRRLRTRVSGPHLMVQFHLELDPHLTLAETRGDHAGGRAPRSSRVSRCGRPDPSRSARLRRAPRRPVRPRPRRSRSRSGAAGGARSRKGLDRSI